MPSPAVMDRILVTLAERREEPVQTATTATTTVH